MTNVILVDKYSLFRTCMKHYLEVNKFISVVADYDDLHQLFDLFPEDIPDVIIIHELEHDPESLLIVQNRLHHFPTLRFLFIVSHILDDSYIRLIKAGVKGCVAANSKPEEILEAINEIAADKTWFRNDILINALDNRVLQGIQHIVNSLSGREIEVLKFICAGYSNKQIANDLNLSPDTIKWHRNNLMRKTNTNNAMDLLRFAVQCNIVDLNESLAIRQQPEIANNPSDQLF